MSIPIEPMLAKKAPDGIPEGEYIFETKWDGMRVIVQREDGRIRLWTRRGQEVTDRFPELLLHDTFYHDGIFDGEICCFDDDGKSNFRTVVGRRHNKHPDDIARRAEEAPATCMLFDCLKTKGVWIYEWPWHKRRKILRQRIHHWSYKAPFYRLSKTYEDGVRLFNRVKRQGLEGVMAKDINAPYYPGKRRRAWLKIKVLFTEDVLVTGFTAGQGKRAGYFGSLIITDMEGNDRGNVGTGFTDADLREYMKMLREEYGAYEFKDYYMLETPVAAEVRHMENTIHGKLREPVFIRFRDED